MGMSAEAMNEIFRNCVNDAQECAKKTKDEGQKGQIYATLALAMANMGVIQVDLSEAAELTPKAEATREGLKPKAAAPKTKHHGSEDKVEEETSASAPAKETKKNAETTVGQIKDEQSDEKMFGAEWTDEAVEFFAKETEFIQEHRGKLYEMYYAASKEEGKSDDEAEEEALAAADEFFRSEIEKATSGACHDEEDINPRNIKYIVLFLEAVERGEDPAEGAYLPQQA